MRFGPMLIILLSSATCGIFFLNRKDSAQKTAPTKSPKSDASLATQADIPQQDFYLDYLLEHS